MKDLPSSFVFWARAWSWSWVFVQPGIPSPWAGIPVLSDFAIPSLCSQNLMGDILLLGFAEGSEWNLGKKNIQRSPSVSPPILISHFSPSTLLGSVILKDSSAQFSHSVVSNSLRPHELQHTRPPCPSPTPGVHPNPCPLSR